MSVEEKRDSSLRIAKAKRRAMALLKVKVEGGHKTMADVLLPSPMPQVEHLSLIELAKWSPRFGAAAQLRLGEAAVAAGVNLLKPCVMTSPEEREWFAGQIRGRAYTGAERARAYKARARDDGSVMLKKQVGRLEFELADARRQLSEGQRQSARAQLTMPVSMAEEMLMDLADAVEAHWRAVSGPVPVEDWAWADERLRARKNEILAAQTPSEMFVRELEEAAQRAERRAA